METITTDQLVAETLMELRKEKRTKRTLSKYDDCVRRRKSYGQKGKFFEVLILLCKKEMSVLNIAELMGVSTRTAYRYIVYLRESGIISSRRVDTGRRSRAGRFIGGDSAIKDTVFFIPNERCPLCSGALNTNSKHKGND